MHNSSKKMRYAKFYGILKYKRITQSGPEDYHHLYEALSARISMTLSRHSSLSFIVSGRSSGLHPVSAQSCCMQVRVGRPAFARPCEGVHWSTSLMSSSLLLQQCPACLVRLILIVFMMGGWWPNSCSFVGCCFQDLFNIAAFLCSCRQDFSPYVQLASIWPYRHDRCLEETALHFIGQV